MFHHMDGYGWGMGWGWLIGLLILLILVWVIVRANRRKATTAAGSPLEILQERYAKGEIDQEEYEKRKANL